MPMTGGGFRSAVFVLSNGQPAHLEVKIDPTAHGPNAVGPITRGVTLKTAGGQQIDFELKGTVVK